MASAAPAAQMRSGSPVCALRRLQAEELLERRRRRSASGGRTSRTVKHGVDELQPVEIALAHRRAVELAAATPCRSRHTCPGPAATIQRTVERSTAAASTRRLPAPGSRWPGYRAASPAPAAAPRARSSSASTFCSTETRALLPAASSWSKFLLVRVRPRQQRHALDVVRAG